MRRCWLSWSTAAGGARPLPVAAALGAVGALVILAIDLGVFAALIGETAAADAGVEMPLWRGLLASFYGGITEELLLRFGVMSALVWLITRMARSENAGPALMWSSIMLVVRAVMLNGILGVLFGYLFWKRGLEAAIVSHFSADVVLQSAAALVATTGAA